MSITVPEPGQEIVFRTLGGEGPDCLLLHGFGSDRLSWLGNSPALLPLARVHALDLPGHGDSGMDVGDGSPTALAARIEAVLDERRLGPAHIVAHSLGGGVAILLAARRPERVASLALVAPVGLDEQIDAGFLHAYPEIDDVDSALTLIRSLVVRPHLMGRQIADRALQQLNRPGARDALRLIAARLIAVDAELRAAVGIVGRSTVPRMVLWGGQDGVIRPSLARLAAFGGEHHVSPEAGHLPHIEVPKIASGWLAGFLAQTTGR